MHDRRLITLLAGTAALGLATLGWAQTTAPTPGVTMAPGSTASATLASTDAIFLRKAREGGLEEVQRAQEAMRSAQRAEVRNIAAMMFEDHRRSNDKLAQLAKGKNWYVPPPVAAADSDQPRTVAGGVSFDDDYLEGEMSRHRETISLYRAQAAGGADPDLRRFATEALPVLEHHLETLQGSRPAK